METQMSLSPDDAKMKKMLIRHPDYEAKKQSWSVFRDVWKGGGEFVEKYTKTFSMREDPLDFNIRKELTPCSAHAKTEVVKVKNALSQRFNEVIRKDGPASYMSAIRGDNFGVDLRGSSMNVFMNQKVLEELCPMGKVGVYIDRDILPENATLRETAATRPYLYTYQTEDILSWTIDDSSEENEFKALFLRESYMKIDPETSLTTGVETRYRMLKKVPNGVEVVFYDKVGEQIDKLGQKSTQVYFLNIRAIPFVVFEISESLLREICGHQIALLNLGSCDIVYATKSNFPFYVEQYDARTDGTPFKTQVVPVRNENVEGTVRVTPSTKVPAQTAATEIQVGTVHGRRYAKDLNQPDFIHPSPEPLKVSMEKQEQLKKEIKALLNTSLSNLTANSVEREKQDNEGFESGLHNIGLELEHGERKIVQIWAMYEDQKVTPTINYPKTYSLQTDEDRQEAAKRMSDLRTKVPSRVFQKEMSKQMAHVLLQDKVDAVILDQIKSEIDSADTMTNDAEEIAKDMENGLVDAETASLARGYKKGVVAKAQQEMVQRLILIKASQTSGQGMGAARGVDDGGIDPKAGQKEKKLANTDPSGKPVDNTRGEGK